VSGRQGGETWGGEGELHRRRPRREKKIRRVGQEVTRGNSQKKGGGVKGKNRMIYPMLVANEL